MQFMKRMGIKTTDKIVDAYTTISICGQLLDESNGHKNLANPYHWSLNSLYNDAMKVYLEVLFPLNGN